MEEACGSSRFSRLVFPHVLRVPESAAPSHGPPCVAILVWPSTARTVRAPTRAGAVRHFPFLKTKRGRAVQIWVDADACPTPIKELLYRAARRTQTKVTLVANQRLRTPRSEFIDTLIVPAGMNVADRRIIELVQPGDLVVTADIPLAAEVVAQGAQALDPRGELYTDANVGERLAVRNLLDELRGGGQVAGGPPALTMKDRQAFANQLDRWLTAATE